MGDPNRTLWVGNLHETVKEEILYELFLQAGPLAKVTIAKDKEGRPRNFAFVTFEHDISVPYTIQLLDGTPLYGKAIRCQLRPGSCHQSKPAAGMNQGYPSQQQGTGGGNYGQRDPSMNPYQTSKPMQNQHQRNAPMGNAPANPYQNNQPMRNQSSPNPQPPHLHKSNTWHGDNMNDMEKGRDRDMREQDRDRDRYSNRDRSSDRGRHSGSDSDSHRNGRGHYDRQNSDRDNRGSPNVESQRDRIVRQQGLVNERYSGGQNRSDFGQREPWQSRQQNNRRGRY